MVASGFEGCTYIAVVERAFSIAVKDVVASFEEQPAQLELISYCQPFSTAFTSKEEQIAMEMASCSKASHSEVVPSSETTVEDE
jgi:hypothetical protein